MEAPGAAPQWYLGQVLDMLCRVVAALPEDLRKGSNPYGVPWELLICAAIVGFFAVFLFLWRSFRSIRSRLYVEREKKLAVELSTLIEEKCELLEKCSLVQKEYEGLESITESNFEESTEAQSSEFVEGSHISETICEKLDSSKSELEDEILSLEEELKEEKSKHSEQDELMEDISNRIQSLQDESKSLKSQLAEAKTTFKIFQMNEERLKIAVKDALNENSQLQESQKQLLLEAEESKEKMNELNEQKVTFEDSILYTKQDICDKENQIKSLTERLLKMQDWAAVLGEDFMDDNLKLEMKSDAENGALLDNQPKGALKSLVHAAKLKASLKTLEGERNQIYIQLTEVDKTKEELGEFIKNLQAEQASLQSESEQLDSENQKLQHKLKVMTELFQENEMMLHRKLTVEENYRLEKEEKLSKADERISHAAEELETYRKRAKDLEEELDRTVHSYQGQILSHEKKAHDNWLAARTAERNLNDLKKENSYLRQKLTETELKFELLEKDPYALDVPNTAFGREHSPYGPSPLGRPSSETRAFLSPPTLLEGPLRLSPLLPGGGGRGSRGPGNPQDHQVTNERGVSSCDKLTDSHREPSDTGSLSPPREQDPRMMIPSLGHPYPDSAILPQRQDRFYSNTGRLSGPAELRSFKMPSLDKADGPESSEVEPNRNDSQDDLGNLHVPDESLPAKSEATGPGFAPPARGPFFPVDARGPFIRRGPPFPPSPGSMYGAPRDYFPPDPAIPLQRQDRFYSNTGRLSGPAELRSFKMPSPDKADGPESSEVEPNRNDSQDDLGNLHVPDESLPAKSEATGPGFAPPARGPFFPVDARGPFIRRGPPFPPSPGSMYGVPRDYFPPGNFPGPPPPPFAMRNVFPPRVFPHYTPPRSGFFPSPPHPEKRSEVPSVLTPPSNEPTTDERPEP